MSDNPFIAQYGPCALIAGGAAGIGAAYADYVASVGLDLFIIDRDPQALRDQCESLSHQYGVPCNGIHADLADPALVDIVSDAVGDNEIGLLIYNAALADVGPFYKPDSGLEHELEKLQVNVVSPFRLLYHYARPMLSRNRGGIVLMSSGSGQQGSPYYSHYAATKAYSIILAESLWYEFKPYNVDVLACIAGMTLSPGVAAAVERGEGKHSVYQTPEEVVEEAMAALGMQPSIMTGSHNRENHTKMRAAPHEFVVEAIAQHAIKNFLGGEVPPQNLDG